MCVVRVVLCWRRWLQRLAITITSPARRLPPASTPDADRSPGASHEDSPCSLRRSPVAPYRLEFTCSGPSRFGVVPISAPTPRDRFAHAVFCASRLRARCLSVLRSTETPPARSFVADLSGSRTGSAPDCSRDLAGTVKIPATSMGFAYCPSQFCFRPRVMTPVRTSRTHMPFRHLPPRVSSWRGPPLQVGRRFVAAAPGVWPHERTVPCDLPAPL